MTICGIASRRLTLAPAVFVDIVQTFLDVRGQTGKRLGNPFGHVPISVEGARRIASVGDLPIDRDDDVRADRLDRHDMLIGLSALLPVADEDHRGAEITGIADKAAGVSNGASGVE